MYITEFVFATAHKCFSSNVAEQISYFDWQSRRSKVKQLWHQFTSTHEIFWKILSYTIIYSTHSCEVVNYNYYCTLINTKLFPCWYARRTEFFRQCWYSRKKQANNGVGDKQDNQNVALGQSELEKPTPTWMRLCYCISTKVSNFLKICNLIYNFISQYIIKTPSVFSW